MLVTDFLTDKADYKDSLRAVAGRHDLRVVRVTDPSDTRPLPDVGLVRVRDGETGASRVVDTSNAAFRAENAARVQAREREIETTLQDAGIRPVTISTEDDAFETLIRHFSPKGKQG